MKTVLVGAIAIYRSVIQNPHSIIENIETSHSNLWTRSRTLRKPEPEIIGNQRANVVSDFRTSSEILNLPKDVDSELDIYFKQAVSDYVCRFNAPIIRHESAYVLLKYEVGQEFQPHHDDSPETPRRVSVVAFLNDNFKGGQLAFDLANFTYEPVAGDIVVFPSNFPYMHASRPIIEGTKYSVVSWWI